MNKNSRSPVMATLLLAIMFPLVDATESFAQNFKQSYDRWTVNPLPCKIKDRNGKEKNLTYHRCRYWAQAPNNAVVRQDECWFFPNDPDPANGITATCNHWVYWVRIDNKAGPVVWGRCPTPMHPGYLALQHLLGGSDLWQEIPREDRAPGKTLHQAEEKFGPTFASGVINAEGVKEVRPEIQPNSGETIQCIDFRRPVFANSKTPKKVSQAYGPVTEAPKPIDYVDAQGNEHSLKYLQCEFVAVDVNGKELRRDRVTYFPNKPVGADDAVSNHWIYWERIDKDAPAVPWARCPTPNHPAFKMAKDATEHWQHVIKKEPGKRPVDCEFGQTQKAQPKIDPQNQAADAPEIQAVDFSKTFSR